MVFDGTNIHCVTWHGYVVNAEDVTFVIQRFAFFVCAAISS